VLPFSKGKRLRRDQRGSATFHDEKGRALAFTHTPAGAVLYVGSPSQLWQRVPTYMDARVVLPAVAGSVLFALGALLGCPVRRLVRRLRRWRRGELAASEAGEPPSLRRARLIARVVLVVQVLTVAAAVALLLAAKRDLTLLSDALDPFVVGLYALAWLGVAGSVPAVAVAAWFWRAGAGGRAARVHHTAAALAAVVLAWFFVTWRIAGTTLVY
jgi:hypothetical protein